ncbi:MAG: hypothetical protein RSA23_10195, partial [Carnobacterium sp.]
LTMASTFIFVMSLRTISIGIGCSSQLQARSYLLGSVLTHKGQLFIDPSTAFVKAIPPVLDNYWMVNH